MIQGRVYEGDIFSTMRNSIKNTVNFENCSEFTEYDYEAEDSKVGSSLGLCIENNYILDSIIPYLKTKSPVKAFTAEEIEKYAGKPLAMSKAIYGTIDYWWILLAVNDYMTPSDFHSFSTLIVPSIPDIENIMDKEGYTNENVGVVPESTDR